MPVNTAMGTFEVPGTGTFDIKTGRFLGEGTGRTTGISGMAPGQWNEPSRGRTLSQSPRTGGADTWTNTWTYPAGNDGWSNTRSGAQGSGIAPRTSANRVPDYRDAQGNLFDGNTGRLVVPAARKAAVAPPPPGPVHRSSGFRPGQPRAETRRQELNTAASQAGAQSIYRDPASARPAFTAQPDLGVLQPGGTAPAAFRGSGGGVDWNQAPAVDSTGSLGLSGSPLAAKASAPSGSEGPALRPDLAQWVEAHRNAPRSVIDGKNIVERFLEKENQRNARTAAEGGGAGFAAAAQLSSSALGVSPQAIAFTPPATPGAPALNFQQASQLDPTSLGVQPVANTFERNPTLGASSRMFGDQLLAENSAVRGGAAPVVATEGGFTTRWINENLPNGMGSFNNLRSFPSAAQSGFSPDQRFYVDNGRIPGISPRHTALTNRGLLAN